MELALILTIAAIVTGAVVGALIRAWSIHSRLYSLEDRIVQLEGVTTREVKIRASGERWKRSTKDEEAMAQLLQAGKTEPAKPHYNWWESPTLKKGAHTP